MKKFLVRVATGAAALAVSVGMLAGTAGPASAATCTTSFDTYSTVQTGTTGSKALAVECLLHESGYATTQNSTFSSDDAGKLKSLQRKHSMKATGRTNAATWAALVARGSKPSLQHGDEGASVRRLRLTLRALGHDELTDSSFYDAATAAAVKSLQGKVGLERTGKTSRAVWAVLQNGGRKVPVAKSSSKGAKALAFAKKQVGDSYRYGAAGPNRWDCSGLTMKAWAAAGKKLPHSAKAQSRIGKKVKKSDLRPGDLVFFYSGPSHVGIYAGGGKVIHAPRPGSKVGYIKISYMPFSGARRPA